MEEIVESLKSIPALILVSVRTEHDEDLSERQNLLQLRLKPLGMMDAAAIIRDIASVDAPSEEVVTFVLDRAEGVRSEEHTSELQSLMRISYAVFCFKKKTKHQYQQ